MDGTNKKEAVGVLNAYANRFHGYARRKGFWDCERNKSEMLMLIVSECAEALEALREGDYDGFETEMADIFIRLMDMCGGLGVDLDAAVEKKAKINEAREYKHGKSF